MRSGATGSELRTSTGARVPQRAAVISRSGRVSRAAPIPGLQQAHSCGVAAPLPLAAARPQQLQRASHVVCVAAQEAPAQQETATKVGGLLWSRMLRLLTLPGCVSWVTPPGACVLYAWRSGLSPVQAAALGVSAPPAPLPGNLTPGPHHGCPPPFCAPRSGLAWSPTPSSSATTCRTSRWRSSCASA